MQTITLYHGSSRIIEKPTWGLGKTYNDYGRAFYCTKERNMAAEWACTNARDGFVNVYSLDESELSVLDLQSGNYHILNWLAILLDNRTFMLRSQLAQEAKDYLLERFLPQYKEYDVIRGYRADDSYFSFANAFLDNAISLSKLQQAMKLGKLGEQTAICSPLAFERLTFEGYELARKEVYYPLKAGRDEKARKAFQDMKSEKLVDEIYMLDILRQKWGNDDARLS